MIHLLQTDCTAKDIQQKEGFVKPSPRTIPQRQKPQVKLNQVKLNPIKFDLKCRTIRSSSLILCSLKVFFGKAKVVLYLVFHRVLYKLHKFFFCVDQMLYGFLKYGDL